MDEEKIKIYKTAIQDAYYLNDNIIALNLETFIMNNKVINPCIINGDTLLLQIVHSINPIEYMTGSFILNDEIFNIKSIYRVKEPRTMIKILFRTFDINKVLIKELEESI